MLVCSVSLRPRRTVAAILAEAGAATATVNTLGIGQLVEEAASASDTVSGQHVSLAAIIETVSAADISSATLTIAGVFAVAEAASAISVEGANLVTAAAAAETATASSTEDATAVGAPTTVTWEPATVANVTLSGGNLVATNTGTTSTDQGARVAATAGKEFGKYYFEDTFTKTDGTPGVGVNYAIGIGTTASTYTGMGSGHAAGGANIFHNGSIYANGTYTGISLTTPTGPQNGDVVSIAVDLDAAKIWFRLRGGDWNNNASYDPASNTGGITIPVGTMVPIATFGGGSAFANGQIQTANFGATAFTYTVPSGFESGWSLLARYAGAVTEAATAAVTQDGTVPSVGGAARTVMAGPQPTYINIDGTARQANADGTMLNL